MPQQPISELVHEDTGRWDINTFISPALAAALEAAPALPEDAADPSLEKLKAAREKLDAEGEPIDAAVVAALQYRLSRAAGGWWRLAVRLLRWARQQLWVWGEGVTCVFASVSPAAGFVSEVA